MVRSQFNSYMLIICSIVILIGIILLYNFISKSHDKSTIQVKKEKVPLLSPRIYLFLVKHGIIGSGPLSKAFVKALTFLEEHIANKDYKYSIPWYIIVGPSLSGKSSILNSLSDLHLPEQDSDQTNFNGCEWFMFMNGIVMEVRDTVFSVGNTKSIINKDWQLLSMLLAYFRPRKPLDGIILTLPVDFLSREDKFAAEKKIIAQNMFDNLFWMQNSLNLRLPVYVLLTKCDLLEGFSSLCLGMSAKEKEQMFGWSSTYSADTAYTSSWVDEALECITGGLKKTILKAAANAAVPETIEESLYVSDNLERLKGNLKLFTNSIFSPNKVGVELVLRGIYLTGSDFEDGRAGKAAVTLNPEFISTLGKKSTLVNFVKDLFCEKIFLEKNIAQPIIDNFVFHGTRVIAKRFMMCILGVLLVVGFYFSSKYITTKTSEFALTLTEIDSTLYQLKNNADSENLKNKTRRLLDYIFKLDPNQLYSFFIPISWFSEIRNTIHNVASDAFDKAVVSSMYSELEKRATTVTELLKVELSNKIVLSPVDLEEFKALKQYVQKVVDLEQTGQSYNRILLEDDENAIENLAKFLYADDITNRTILKQKLKKDKSKFKEFNLARHKKEILQNIVTLQKAFVEHCFSDILDKVFVSLASNIENFIRDVENQDKPVYLKDIVILYKKLDTVINFLRSNVLNWWDSEKFNPGKEYKELLELMSKSSLINDKFIKNFKEYVDAAFIDFKFRISNISSSITGNLIAKGRHIVVSEPSKGLMSFYNDLQGILKQKFLINVEDQSIITEIDDDKMLLWNKNLMQQCTKVIKSYKDFNNTSLKSFNINLQPLYREMMKKLVYNTVKSIIAKSQIIEDVSQNVSISMEEGTLRRVCSDLDAVFKDLLLVAEFFKEDFASNFGQTEAFLQMIYANYVRVLNTINALFKTKEPFSLRREMFDDWDGRIKPNLAAFAVTDQEELNSYITAQISRLTFLSKVLAEPVVNLLRSKYFNLATDDVLLNQWVSFIDAVDNYNNKTPGNSISVLEMFIKKTLSEFTLDNIVNENKLDAFLDIKKDFFLSKRASIARYLKYRSQELIYLNSFITYNRVAKFFNEYIAGFFPFVNGYSTVYPDCGSEPLENFIMQFKKIGAPVKKALATIIGVNPEAQDALRFIEQIENIMPFLEGWLQNSSKKTALASAIAFKLDFRTEKGNEIGGDQIIDWRLKVGEDFLTIDDKDKLMNWAVGQEVKAIFQWAADSNEVPHADTKGLVDVLGPNAVFKYIGNWALIRLIKAHQALSEVYPGAGVTLLFRIPTVHRNDFKPFRDVKLFCRIKFFEKNKDAWTPIKIPDFPHIAPILEMKVADNG